MLRGNALMQIRLNSKSIWENCSGKSKNYCKKNYCLQSVLTAAMFKSNFMSQNRNHSSS